METVHLPSGATARWFLGDGTGPTFVTAPAMGVPAAAYQRFARLMREHGHTVVTADYRGQGESRVALGRGSDWGYPAHAEDLRAVIGHVRSTRPGEVVLVGHSLGGQVAAVLEAASPGLFDALVLAAAGTVHWRAFRGRQLVGPVLFPPLFDGLGRLRGVFEGTRFGFGRQSPRLMTEWRRFAWSGRLPGGEPAQRAFPLLAVSFAGDDYAPPAAVDALAVHLPGAKLTRRHLAAPTGHVGWLRDPAPLVDEVLAWL